MHRQAAEAVVCYIALCSKNESSLLFWIIFASFSSAAKRKSFTFSGLCVCVLTAHLREVNECYFLPLCKQESFRTQTTAPWYVHLLVPDIECCCIPSAHTHTPFTFSGDVKNNEFLMRQTFPSNNQAVVWCRIGTLCCKH